MGASRPIALLVICPLTCLHVPLSLSQSPELHKHNRVIETSPSGKTNCCFCMSITLSSYLSRVRPCCICFWLALLSRFLFSSGETASFVCCGHKPQHDTVTRAITSSSADNRLSHCCCSARHRLLTGVSENEGTADSESRFSS